MIVKLWGEMSHCFKEVAVDVAVVFAIYVPTA